MAISVFLERIKSNLPKDTHLGTLWIRSPSILAQQIDIAKDGPSGQGGQTIGQIEVGTPESDPTAISKLGSTYFAMSNKSAPVPVAQNTDVMQGQIEQSNVPVSESAVKLVGVMRQFEMLQKAMTSMI